MMARVNVTRLERATSTVRAAIDIGTNSIHLVVARVDDSGRIDIITREKETVRLGHGSGEMTELEPDAIDRGIATLRRFRQVADGENARITAVATSATAIAFIVSALRMCRSWSGARMDRHRGAESPPPTFLPPAHRRSISDQPLL